jgi:hypothetical protein
MKKSGKGEKPKAAKNTTAGAKPATKKKGTK